MELPKTKSVLNKWQDACSQASTLGGGWIDSRWTRFRLCYAFAYLPRGRGGDNQATLIRHNLKISTLDQINDFKVYFGLKILTETDYFMTKAPSNIIFDIHCRFFVWI
jgi:hypothetical protein